jgi:predicted secreted hydrolase
MSKLKLFLLLLLILPGKSLQFPRDHGAHEDYNTEWWYFTGHLKSKDRTFGFELTFFRVGVNHQQISSSAWNVKNVYLAHFAVTDDKNKVFYHAEQKSRGNFNEAGASVDNLDVWNKTYSAKLNNEEIVLSAIDQDLSLRLNLKSKKSPTLHGDNGYSKKGSGAGDASYYSSLTRLVGAGELTIKDNMFQIDQASVWFDHEFSSSEMTRAKVGWDWFAVQLENDEELMVYQLRDEKNLKTEYSSGTYIKADGSTVHLSASDFVIERLASWKSEETGITYPSKWQLKIPKLSLDLKITPTVQSQELVTKQSTGVTYWEGRSRAEGQLNQHSILGDAYVELVGYR